MGRYLAKSLLMKIVLDQASNPVGKLKLKFLLPIKIAGLGPLLAAAIFFAGCASQPPVALAPVGPAPLASVQQASGHGSLVVYSPLELIADLNAAIGGQPSNDWGYSGYKIFSSDGKRLKSVSNNVGTVQLHPQTIELPAGKYVVMAKADGGIRITVPVVIASHQTTVLHLDGADSQPGETGFNQTNSVHLPDGRIVGWRAGVENSPAS